MTLTAIPTEAFTKIAVGIDRPEDVVVGPDGRVFASDHQCAVAEIFPDGSFKRLGPKGGAPNGLNMDRQGRVLIANFGIYDREDGPLQRFDPATGTHETLLAEVDGKRLTSVQLSGDGPGRGASGAPTPPMPRPGRRRWTGARTASSSCSGPMGPRRSWPRG